LQQGIQGIGVYFSKTGIYRSENGKRAVAYVNHKAQSVVVNPQALPTLSEEETYQMWADLDGEMISMGVAPYR
jgi:hypothetical protein